VNIKNEKKSAMESIAATEAGMPAPVLRCWLFHKRKLGENKSPVWAELTESDRQHLFSSLSAFFLCLNFTEKNPPDLASMFMFGVAAHRLLPFVQELMQKID
jgi:hypothetical protein